MLSSTAASPVDLKSFPQRRRRAHRRLPPTVPRLALRFAETAQRFNGLFAAGPRQTHPARTRAALLSGRRRRQPRCLAPPAAAVEMIHCFSLIHDDLPAMDDDDLRRGRPTNHKVYGDALAILAGDALNTLAFELLAARTPDPALALKLIKGTRRRHRPRRDDRRPGPRHLPPRRSQTFLCPPAAARKPPQSSKQIHRMKDRLPLIRCACRMGALTAGASPDTLAAIDTYGRAIGLAFQIVDDILDVTATEEQMGKKTNKDSEKGKLTLPPPSSAWKNPALPRRTSQNRRPDHPANSGHAGQRCFRNPRA